MKNILKILEAFWLIIKGLLWPLFEAFFLSDYINTWIIYILLAFLTCGGIFGVAKGKRHKLLSIASTIAGILGIIFMLTEA